MPATYRILLTRQSYLGLEEIFDYIQQDSPHNAAQFIAKILDAIDSLKQFPNRNAIAGRTRKRKSQVHRAMVKPYLIYYRIDEKNETVTVLRVLHGARRQPKRFEDE